MKKLLALILFCSVALSQPRPVVNSLQTWNGFQGQYKTTYTTTIPEGSNLYFTNIRADSAIHVNPPLKWNISTGTMTLPLTFTSPLRYDSVAGVVKIDSVSGFGAPYSLWGVNASGLALGYKKLVVGGTLSLSTSNDTIKLTGSAGGGGGSALDWINNQTDAFHLANPRTVTFDVSNGISIGYTNAGDTGVTVSIPTNGTMTMGTFNVTTLNVASANNKVLYQTSGTVSGTTFGVNHTSFFGKGATTAPVFGSILGSYGIDTIWDDANNTETLRMDSTKLATAYANSLKANKSITLTAGTGLTGGGDLSANRTFAIANSGVSSGSYGGIMTIPVPTVNLQGQITSMTTVQVGVIARYVNLGAGDSVNFTCSGISDSSYSATANWCLWDQLGAGADGGYIGTYVYPNGHILVRALTPQSAVGRRVYVIISKNNWN